MFKGAYTAIITPFRRDGAVDYDRLRQLVEFQIAGGIDGLVPVGTTGESPTLDMDEHIEVVRVVIEAAAGRVKIVAGTGGNSTAEALELTEKARDLGADGTLQVTPYYNKPTQAGLVRHFSAVADLVHAAAAGRWDEARALHYRYYRLFTDIFLETNPIPIKAAMEMAGHGAAVYRLPLCEMSPANLEKLRATLRQAGVIA